MRKRIEIGTDVAAYGLWDQASGGAENALKDTYKEVRAAQDADAAAGKLLIIETGGDGGGPVEVFVEEPVPAETLRHARTINRDFLVRCTSGILVLGGLEDYRSVKPQITGPDSVFPVEPGPYRVRLHVGENEDQVSETELITVVGEKDFHYYNRVNSQQSLGCLGIFAAFIPAVLWGWDFWLCVVSGVVIAAVGYTGMGFLNTLNDRYQRIGKKIEAFHKHIPLLILELQAVDEETAATLEGGRVTL